MKKIIWLLSSILILLTIASCSPLNNVPALENIRQLTEEELEADLARVTREDLAEVWGKPDMIMAEQNADVWDIDEESLIMVYWTRNGRFKDAGIGIK